MGKILKILTTVFVFCLLMACSSITASAAEKQLLATESKTLVGDGYTEGGIYYEVYDVYEHNVTSANKDTDVTIQSVISVFVTREVTYQGYVESSALPESVYWTEKLDNYTTLRGTLKRTYIYYIYSAGITTTVVQYEGTLVGRV